MTKEKDLRTFKNELFEVAVKLENGEVLFDVEKVAKSLGITQIKKDKVYVRWERVNEYLPSNSPQVGKGDFIVEPLVYKLAFKASNEVAEAFQDWLAMEVIPTIRKTGGYVEDDREEEFVSKYFPSFSEEVKLAMVQDLMRTNKELKTKANKWSKFLETDSTYNFEQVAKMLSTQANEEYGLNFKVTKISLPKYLREKGILSKNKSGNSYTNLPNKNYEQYFDVISTSARGRFETTQARIKPSGVEFIYDELVLDGFKLN